MAKNGQTKDDDKKYLELRRQLKIADKASVDIGILGKDFPSDLASKGGKSGGLNVAEYAIVNEFGSEKVGIPERSFLRSTVDANRLKSRKRLRSLFNLITLGKMTVEKALGLFGVEIVGKVKKTITNLRSPPNAPSTVARKRSSNPLIDSGTMRNRIKSKVRT